MNVTSSDFDVVFENPDQIAEGWCLARIGELLTINYGKGLKESDRNGGPVPVYGSNGVVGYHDVALTDSPVLVIGRKGSIGAVHESYEPCWPIDTTYFVDDFHSLSHTFVCHALRCLELNRLDTSSAIPGLNRNDIYAQVIPLPPLAEQKRIVEKVEQLLEQVNASRDRLAKVPAIMKAFRQSVLAAACSGRLTADWREANPDVESAQHLLQTISDERRTRGDKRHIAPVVANDELPDIPNGWVWTTFGFALGELRNGISTKPTMEPPGHAILRISAVRSGRVSFDDLRYLPDSDALVDVYALRNDDLLFTRYNGSLELLGVCGMVRGLEERTLLYPDKLMRVRFDHKLVEPAYAEIFFQGPGSRKRLTLMSKSSAGQQGVSGADLKAQWFALPPLPEQQEIVKRVEALFGLADSTEKRVSTATLRAEKLTQAILAKAFRGELVPTEAELARQEGREYEPASVLLERIRREREAQPATTKKRKVEERPKMAKITADSIYEWVRQIPHDSFTFGELRHQVGGDYDALKDAVFELLSGDEPRLRQVFDQGSESMRLEKVKR